VDEVVAQAVGAGATLVKKPQLAFWGGYSGHFKDLDGHLWDSDYDVRPAYQQNDYIGWIERALHLTISIYVLLCHTLAFTSSAFKHYAHEKP